MPSEPLLLSIETATLAGSLAILRGNHVLEVSSGDPAVSHSNTLLADIDRLFLRANLSLQDVDCFAVASGPGSFTGLRIGIATIKALASTLNRPCIGVPTLEAIAHSAGPSGSTVAMLPAGRGEVFAQMFSTSVDGHVIALDAPVHLSPEKLIAKYVDRVGLRWAGEGANIYANLIHESADKEGHEVLNGAGYPNTNHESWVIAEPTINLATHVGLLALARLESVDELTPINLHAMYVRPSDAEMKC